MRRNASFFDRPYFLAFSVNEEIEYEKIVFLQVLRMTRGFVLDLLSFVTMEHLSLTTFSHFDFVFIDRRVHRSKLIVNNQQENHGAK